MLCGFGLLQIRFSGSLDRLMWSFVGFIGFDYFNLGFEMFLSVFRFLKSDSGCFGHVWSHKLYA